MTNADADTRQVLMRLLLRVETGGTWIKALRCLTFLRYPEVRKLEKAAGYPSLWPEPPLPQRFVAILVRDALLWEDKGWFESDTTLYYIGAVEACLCGSRTWRKVIQRYYYDQDWLPPQEWLEDRPDKIDQIEFTHRFRWMYPSWFHWPCFRRTPARTRRTESETAEVTSSKGGTTFRGLNCSSIE